MSDLIPHRHWPVVYTVNPYHNGTALASLLLGLATFVTFGATGIPAVICGHIALTQVKAGTSNQKGWAVTGLVLGYLAVGGWLAWWTFWWVLRIAAGVAS